jgi:uncharacterized Zn finger protein
VRAVEETTWGESELRPGRALARSGSVGQVGVEPGGFLAAVVVGDAVCTVTGVVPVLDDASLDALVETVAAEAGRIGALLAGDLPHTLVEHAEEAGVELLPEGRELAVAGTCGAATDPCVHALAVLYQLTWLVDADPFVLLHLRGLPREALLARLHQRTPAAGEPAPEASDLDLDLDTGYDAAVRAARLLELAADPSSPPVDHLL